ncbi:MAG: serine/threonine protein kinase, partial [Bacteroidetes bacterium]|nr:serine/threonine protein kinase [Bacteroidota bacterium]
MALRRRSDIVGKVVDGYQIEEVLGRGGMGIVYKAVDTSLDRVVALKVMNPLLVEDEQFFRRFKAEAKALGRLKHPNIVGVFTLRHTEDYLFIVMEYVDGGTLMDLILHHKAIPWHNTVPIIQQTLNAVDYAHRQHVIHRDIKPRNILITSSGIAKVTDFGLAKIQDLSVATRALTRTGITGGTLYYMPPEQLEGLLKVDHRGDIYSLGMTYYVMLAGRTPFDKLSSEFAILKAIDAHDFPALGQLDTDIPEPLVRMV